MEPAEQRPGQQEAIELLSRPEAYGPEAGPVGVAPETRLPDSAYTRESSRQVYDALCAAACLSRARAALR